MITRRYIDFYHIASYSAN